MVDRQSFMSKKDCRLRDEKEDVGAEQSYVRVRCDVQDLDLSAIDACLRAGTAAGRSAALSLWAAGAAGGEINASSRCTYTRCS